MLASNFPYFLNWFLISFIIGIAFLPLTFLLFSKFKDKGYIFSKIIGLIIISYVIFVLATIRLLRFSQFNLVLILIIAFAVNYFIFLKKKVGLELKKKFLNSLKANWKIYFFEEALFFIMFYFWSYIKTFQPNINGLEKFMDFGFINSILRGDYFPARDMWFTSLTINYYYFGHLATAVLTKISNVPASITFNLMQALVFTFCFTASFSIGLNLYFLCKGDIDKKIDNLKMIISGLLTAVLVVFAGNLHTVYAFFTAYPNESPIPPWQLVFSPLSFPNSYWYPNATRFIYHTIHEFPMYSWVVSDLHSHVLDIPFVLLTIAFLITFFFSKKINYLKIFFISFLASILYMTSAWDGAIYLGLSVIIIIYKESARIKNLKILNKRTPLNLVFYSCILVIGYFIFSLPFNLFFKPFVSGIGILCAPQFLIAKGKIGPFLFEAGHCQRSPLWQLFILYGFFYFWVISFALFLYKIYKKRLSKITTIDKFIILLIIFSTVLIIVPEFLYIKDIYPDHYRANTMFKLVYQAFILLSICSAYIIIRIFSTFKKNSFFSKSLFLHVFYFLFSLVIISIVLIYPYLSTTSYYNNLVNQQDLDGTKYLKSLYPSDYQAIRWLNKNIKGQPVILEAQGDSYTDYARISANTGLPTVLGWTVHEWLWRGTYAVPAPRIEETRLLYESKDITQTKALIKKYSISFIFIGALEREKYTNLNEDKFSKLGKMVYQLNSTKIYRVH
jgi:YYY domain-containing protein